MVYRMESNKSWSQYHISFCRYTTLGQTISVDSFLTREEPNVLYYGYRLLFCRGSKMIVLDEQKLSLLFEEIAQGFVHTPLEISIFCILMSSFFLTFLLTYRIQTRKSIKADARIAQRLYELIIRSRGFNLIERKILERMTKYLGAPQKKNLLVENQHIFNLCARKLRKEEHIPDASIAALRLKLGFKKNDPEQILHSSAELPENLPLLVIQKGRTQNNGRLIKLEPHSLTIELENDQLPPRPGLPVEVRFQNHSGVFSFSTSIQKCGKGLLMVAHSESIKRLQRRRFYRRKIRLPVYIKRAHSHEMPIRSALIDLGGGGASLTNTAGFLQTKDEIVLSFFLSREEMMNLTAKVIRISNQGRVLHVAFGLIPESSRDRILGYLFRRG